MKQPTKDVLREQLALAASEIIRLREVCTAAHLVLAGARAIVAEHDRQPKSWWRNFFA